ncbi:hypothetical protein ACT453_33345, partial [Bacillus sp. D-CC]
MGKKYVRGFHSERRMGMGMKLVFVRHGEGEHTKDLPASLQVLHIAAVCKVLSVGLAINISVSCNGTL